MLRRLPNPVLRPFVKTVWVASQTAVAQSAATTGEHVLPTGYMSLVFRLSGPPLRLFDRPQLSGQVFGHSVVGGVRSSFYMKDVSAPACSVGAVLLPGAAEILFGIPADALAEHHTRLDDLWGHRADLLREQLIEAGSPYLQLELFESFLAAYLPRVKGIHPAIAQALARLDANTNVHSLALQSGYSHRRFIELFRRTTGLTPKRYCRVIRFQNTVQRVSADPMIDWSDLALASGYSDQSHFNREFREFAGITPQEYRKLAPISANHVPIQLPLRSQSAS